MYLMLMSSCLGSRRCPSRRPRPRHRPHFFSVFTFRIRGREFIHIFYFFVEFFSIFPLERLHFILFNRIIIQKPFVIFARPFLSFNLLNMCDFTSLMSFSVTCLPMHGFANRLKTPSFFVKLSYCKS